MCLKQFSDTCRDAGRAGDFFIPVIDIERLAVALIHHQPAEAGVAPLFGATSQGGV